MLRIAFLLCLVALGGGAASARDAELGELQPHPSILVGDVRLSLVVFHEDRFRLVVIDNAAQGKPRFADLRAAMCHRGCVAGTNGGFFAPERWEPFGLMISRGVATGTFDPKSWMNGVFVVREGRPGLESAETFVPGPGVSDALQGGPILLRAGKTAVGLEASQQTAARTFVCQDGSGRWALGIATRCTFKELAEALRSEKVRELIAISFALNLDGGPSTGFWARGEGQPLYLAEKWPVRNYLGVVRSEPFNKSPTPPTATPTAPEPRRP